MPRDGLRHEQRRPVARLEAREHRKSRISGPRRHRRLVAAQTHEGSAVLIVPVVSDQDDDATAVPLQSSPIRSSTLRPSARSTSRSRPSARRAAPIRSPGLSHRRSRWPACSRSGLGKDRDEWPADVIRRAAGVAARSLNGTETVITTLSDLDLEAAIEGLILGAYRFTDFRSAKTAPKDAGLREITALTADTKTKGPRTRGAPKTAAAAAERAAAIATAVATARDLVNTPPSHLYPAEFAKRAKALGEAAGLEVEVLNDKELAKDGYGGVIGVGKGSSRPPRLVRLIHRWRRRPKRPRRSRWSARASRSTPAASRSSPPPTCTT